MGQANATPGSTVARGPVEWFHPALMTLIIAEIAVITLVAIYMSAGSVSKEREDGTLDIMLTTPITPRYYVWGKLRGLVRFLSVMISLPVITLALVALYTFVGQLLGWSQASIGYNNISYDYMGNPITTVHHVPLLIPEAPVLMLLMLVPFVALCVGVGMFWSLKAKGVLGAVVPSVAIIGAGSLVLGLCGLSASGSIPLIGPVLNAFSPMTSVVMIVDPATWVQQYTETPAVGRVSLFIGAVAVCAGYATIVWAMIAAMVRGFDHTVRKLSGGK
ncbi:ABC transporter permease subunit [Phycisphaeraceae bacterium D3-23]